MSGEAKQVRPEKQAIVAEFETRLKNAEYLFFADYTGLSMAMTDDLRGRLRKSGARLQVVRNRLLRQAARRQGLTALDVDIAGPTAVVAGRGDVVEAAKVLTGFIKEKDKPVLKLGYLEGSLLSVADVQALASLPAKPVLQAKLLGTLAAPMSRLVGVMQQKMSSLLYVLKAAQEQKGSGSQE